MFTRVLWLFEARVVRLEPDQSGLKPAHLTTRAWNNHKGHETRAIGIIILLYYYYYNNIIILYY